MNLRHLKKREKRAKKELIKLGALRESDFDTGITAEDYPLDAPNDLHRRYVDELGHLRKMLNGTPVVSRVSGYYEPEWECELPSVYLDEYLYWQDEMIEWEKKWTEEERESKLYTETDWAESS